MKQRKKQALKSKRQVARARLKTDRKMWNKRPQKGGTKQVVPSMANDKIINLGICFLSEFPFVGVIELWTYNQEYNGAMA